MPQRLPRVRERRYCARSQGRRSSRTLRNRLPRGCCGPSIDRLTSHENSVLSGEQTYALDLDALRQIPATVGASPPEPVSDGSGDPAAAWEGLEQTAVAVLVSAARAVANIDTVALVLRSSASAPTSGARPVAI